MSNEDFSSDENNDVVIPEKKKMFHKQVVNTDIRRAISAPPDEYNSSNSPTTPDYRSDPQYMEYYERQKRLNPRLPQPIPSRSWFNPRNVEWGIPNSRPKNAIGKKHLSTKSKFNFNAPTVFPTPNVDNIDGKMSSSSISSELGNEMIGPSTTKWSAKRRNENDISVEAVKDVIKDVVDDDDDDQDERLLLLGRSSGSSSRVGSGRATPEITEDLTTPSTFLDFEDGKHPTILSRKPSSRVSSLGDIKSTLSETNLESEINKNSPLSIFSTSHTNVQSKTNSAPLIPNTRVGTVSDSTTSSFSTTSKRFDTKTFFHPKSISGEINNDGRGSDSGIGSTTTTSTIITGTTSTPPKNKPPVFRTYTTDGFVSKKGATDYNTMFSPLAPLSAAEEFGKRDRSRYYIDDNKSTTATDLFKTDQSSLSSNINNEPVINNNNNNQYNENSSSFVGGGGDLNMNDHRLENQLQKRQQVGYGGYQDYNQSGGMSNNNNNNNNYSSGGGGYNQQQNQMYGMQQQHQQSQQNNYENYYQQGVVGIEEMMSGGGGRQFRNNQSQQQQQMGFEGRYGGGQYGGGGGNRMTSSNFQKQGGSWNEDVFNNNQQRGNINNNNNFQQNRNFNQFSGMRGGGGGNQMRGNQMMMGNNNMRGGMDNMMNQDNNKLKELCGQYYEQHLKQMFFVITHVDETGVTENMVDGTLLNLITEHVETQNTGLMNFLSRIKKNRILVDYKKQSHEEILEKVLFLIEQKEDELSRLLPNPDIFSFSESALEDCCKKELKKNIDEYFRRHVRRWKNAHEGLNKVEKLVKHYQVFYNEFKIFKQSLESLKKDVLEEDRMIEDCKADLLLLKENLISRSSELNNFREQIRFFQKISNESRLLDIWKFKAIHKKRITRNNSFDMNIKLQNDHKNVYILAIHSNALKFLDNFIKEDNVVTFKILERIKQFAQTRKSPILKVLDYEHKDFDCKIRSDNEGRIFEIKSKYDFVLFYCFKESIKNTLIYREMNKLFTNKKAQLEEEIKDIEHRIILKNKKLEISTNCKKERIQKFKDISRKLQNYLKQSEIEYFNVTKNIEIQYSCLSALMSQHENEIPKRQLGIIQEVGMILNENLINHSIKDEVKKFQNEILSHIKEYNISLDRIGTLKSMLQEHDVTFSIHIYED